MSKWPHHSSWDDRNNCSRTPWSLEIEHKIFLHIKNSIPILGYLEAKFDYDYFILTLALGSHNSTPEISSDFQQN